MASVEKTSKTGWKIVFYVDRDKQTFRFNGSEEYKDLVKTRVEDMVDCVNNGLEHSAETMRWVRKVETAMLDKLERTGLLDAAARPRKIEELMLDELARKFLEKRAKSKSKANKPSKGKDSSNTRRKTAIDSIVRIMGENTRVDRVTQDQAEKFRDKMLEDYSEASVSRAIGYARELFNFAIDNNWAKSNPFKDVDNGSQVNESKWRYISEDTIRELMAAETCPQWRLLLAMGRWAGVRMPSEVQSMRWGDIDFENKVVRIRSKKTEHLPGKAIRAIPLFPEIAGPLAEVRGDGGQADDDRVFTIYPESIGALTTPLRQRIRRAGMKAWPDGWKNMRRSRESDLIASFGLTVACKWIGNTPEVAMRHYAMLRPQDHARAVCPQNDLNSDYSGDRSGDTMGNRGDTQKPTTKNNNHQDLPQIPQEGRVMVVDGVRWVPLEDLLEVQNGQTRT